SDGLTVKVLRLLSPVVKPDDTNSNGNPIKNPITVGVSPEDVPGTLYAVQAGAVSSAADALCRQQPGALAAAGFDHGPALLEPVATQVGLPRYPVTVQAAQGVHIAIAQLGPHLLVAQERRVADDEVSLRPFRLARVLRVGQVEDGVCLLNPFG